MTGFTFVHAADLHLDSPLLGLAGKSADYAARVEAASREAFDNLVALAIDEGCRFMLLAGDIFDGDLRNFQTGLYFMEGMRRLPERFAASEGEIIALDPDTIAELGSYDAILEMVDRSRFDPPPFQLASKAS